MSSKKEVEPLDYNLLINNDIRGQHQLYIDNTKIFANRKSAICMIIGAISGLFLTQLLILSFPKISSYYEHKNISDNHSEYDPYRIPEKLDINFGSHSHENEDTTIADQLFTEVRVLCWVMTYPSHHEEHGKKIKKTWGSRCNKLIFMSSEKDIDIGAVDLSVPESEDNLWRKTKEALKYIYQHHLGEYDWFLKADDDTYVILENLRKMLYAYSADFPIYLGCKYKSEVKQGYMTGGAGYVLSREALKRFIEKALPDASKCRSDNNGSAEIELGKCMENVDVVAGDSRDEYERGRMFPFKPEKHLIGDPFSKDNSYQKYLKDIYYQTDKGLNCCSDHAISFNNINPRDMYVLDYFIYHLRPFGITPAPDVLPEKKSMEEIIAAIGSGKMFNGTVENGS